MINSQNKIKRLLRHRFFIPILLICFVVAINSPYIFGYAIADPVYTRSALGVVTERGSLEGEYTIDPNNGFSSQALGKRVAADFIKGKIAWWNHYEAVGSPLIGGMQAGFLMPLQLLLLMQNGLLYIHLILEILAALCTFFFLRRIGSNELAATLGAIAFAANGTFAWLTNAAFNPIAFLPMLLLGFEVLLATAKNEEKSHAKSFIVIALAVAGSLYAGFPETGFINTTFALGWAFVRSLYLPWVMRRQFYKKLSQACLVGLGLAAPILFAFAAYVSTTELGVHSDGAQLTLPLLGVAPLIAPYVYGSIGMASSINSSVAQWWGGVGGYIPITVVASAVVGFFSVEKQRFERWYLVGWILIMILSTFGIFGVDKIFSLPGLSSIVIARYAPPSYIFATVILMSYGMSAIIDSTIHRQRKTLVYASITHLTITILACITSVAYVTSGIGRQLKIAYGASILWLIFVPTLFFAGTYFSKKYRLFIVLITCVVVIDVAAMFMIPIFSAPRAATIHTGSIRFLKDNLSTGERFYTMGPVQPNYGSYFGIVSININDLPQKSYAKYIVEKLNRNSSSIVFNGANMADPRGTTPKEAFIDNIASYEELSVKYVVTFPGLFSEYEIRHTGLAKVFEDNISQIFELPNLTPYVSFLGGPCKYELNSFDELNVDCAEDATLVRRAQYDGGWAVYIDGKNGGLSKYKGLFQSVKLGKGKHRIVFKYEPRFVRVAYVIMVVSLFIIVQSSVIGYYKKVMKQERK